MKIQGKVKGGRNPLPSCVLPAIKMRVAALANKHNVSKSFVIATILAEALGITQQEKYYALDTKTRKQSKAS